MIFFLKYSRIPFVQQLLRIQLRNRSCAMGTCEPCQAGNRAALSGTIHVPQGRRFRSCIRGSISIVREGCGCIRRFTASGVPKHLPTWSVRSISLRPCSTRWRRGGCRTPIFSPARAARARRPAPKYLRARSTASIRKTATPATAARAALASRAGGCSMWSSWTRRRTTAWTACARCVTRPSIRPRR